MTLSVEAEGLALAGAATPLPASERLKLLFAIGLLLLLLNLGAPGGGLIGIPVLFFLKNRLHLHAHQFAQFNLLVGIPLYLSFVFGFLRDRWSPFGAGDRGHLALFGAVSAAIYGAIAFVHPTYGLLLGGLLIATVAVLMYRQRRQRHLLRDGPGPRHGRAGERHGQHHDVHSHRARGVCWAEC